ncbi:methionine gamma-lyase family protein [Mahella sp.]|uniref:methionine gamma-lyase family protein n=1 Tax=Mahella sp. TaxID=2798721 RepID=UPI0025C4C5F9|nr:methionine gamma-lyase family protein [Mahella sp.]
MLDTTKEFLKSTYDIDQHILALCQQAEDDIKHTFIKIDNIRSYNQYNVIAAMQREGVGERHFAATSGYGYDDQGRDALERIYARIFGAEDAIVRAQIASGTHAISLCFYGLLRPGDVLLSISGRPYDTLQEVIGISGNSRGSLREWGIDYKEVELSEDGLFDKIGIKKAIELYTPKVIAIQRSRGYQWRQSIDVNAIGNIIQFIRGLGCDAAIVVDNCYGEFTELIEPTQVGADIAAGSLIKNPGGGIAPTGGYIVGKKDMVECIAYSLTAPGIGKEVGSYAGGYRNFYQGLFLAPHIVGEALKGAILASRIFELSGYSVFPASHHHRTDIIQSIRFEDPEKLKAFCRGIQKAGAVDSFVTPEPWDMPGYEHQVIMAAGTFVQGSSIELSADGPMRPPYIGHLQGGLTYDHVKLGIMLALKEMDMAK